MSLCGNPKNHDLTLKLASVDEIQDIHPGGHTYWREGFSTVWPQSTNLKVKTHNKHFPKKYPGCGRDSLLKKKIPSALGIKELSAENTANLVYTQ